MPASLRTLLAFLLLFTSAFAFAAPVDVNTADAETLAQAMHGIGIRKAQAIVDYRQKNGPFKSLDELTNVKGIGKKTLEVNRETITVVQPTPPPVPKHPAAKKRIK